MKRLLLLAVLLVVPSMVAAQGMHHMMKDIKDERTVLNIPAKMKVMQKKMMRQHMVTVATVVSLIADGKLEQAGKLAKAKLGTDPEDIKRCSRMAKMAGEPDFLKLGMAMHQTADELAEHASKGHRDATLKSLAALINSCNACHERFRH